MHNALENTFEPYQNTELATTGEGPIIDADKQTLKHNLRKQDLFEQALYFSENLFGINAHGALSSELLLEFTSCVLSIVLSHHYQKRDIKSMVNGTQVDFQLVRETMYKYSKKAEDRFFKNPCMAYLFIKFAQSPLAKTQIMNKQPKNQQNDDDEDQIDLNMKQHEVNERILAEMQHMKQEASKILFKQFLTNVEQICLKNI